MKAAVELANSRRATRLIRTPALIVNFVSFRFFVGFDAGALEEAACEKGAELRVAADCSL